MTNTFLSLSRIAKKLGRENHFHWDVLSAAVDNANTALDLLSRKLPEFELFGLSGEEELLALKEVKKS